jgi:hypothetical protein
MINKQDCPWCGAIKSPPQFCEGHPCDFEVWECKSWKRSDDSIYHDGPYQSEACKIRQLQVEIEQLKKERNELTI